MIMYLVETQQRNQTKQKVSCYIVLLSGTCLEDLETTPYSGAISVTNHGFTCQPWVLQYPHNHNFDKDDYFPEDGSVTNASNYCRDPLGYGRPWCYTVNPSVRSDYCTFSICKGE